VTKCISNKIFECVKNSVERAVQNNINQSTWEMAIFELAANSVNGDIIVYHTWRLFSDLRERSDP